MLLVVVVAQQGYDQYLYHLFFNGVDQPVFPVKAA